MCKFIAAVWMITLIAGEMQDAAANSQPDRMITAKPEKENTAQQKE
ncbi:MAG: hypothetical protein LBJ92_00255 [Holosporales bacterium]|nr:hypothetical protein [Holosporales bacterium]